MNGWARCSYSNLSKSADVLVERDERVGTPHMTPMVIEQGYIAPSTAARRGARAPMAVCAFDRHNWQTKVFAPDRYRQNLPGSVGREHSWPLFSDAAFSPSDVALG